MAKFCKYCGTPEGTPDLRCGANPTYHHIWIDGLVTSSPQPSTSMETSPTTPILLEDLVRRLLCSLTVRVKPLNLIGTLSSGFSLTVSMAPNAPMNGVQATPATPEPKPMTDLNAHQASDPQPAPSSNQLIQQAAMDALCAAPLPHLSNLDVKKFARETAQAWMKLVSDEEMKEVYREIQKLTRPKGLRSPKKGSSGSSKRATATRSRSSSRSTRRSSQGSRRVK